MNRLIIEPLGLKVNKSGQLCSIPNKWATLMESSAFEPLFFGSGGSMFSMARVPQRTSAASLQGRLRANKRRGGGKVRNTRARERNLSITITQNQSSTEWELHQHCQQAREQQHGQ
jgi:hypothetical protein